MGIYLNPGYENFRRTLAAKIYVDKSMMIKEINEKIDEGENFICMSRPRRFGKTIAGNMLSAYYSRGCDGHDLFNQLNIASDPSYEEKINKYNVIKIDMNSEYQNAEDKSSFLKELLGEIKSEMIEAFSDCGLSKKDSLGRCILKTYSNRNEQFIIIIDEYDVLVREQVQQKLFDEYLSLMNGLFKSDTLRPAIALAYLTGILPIVRDKIQSKLNNFREYTIVDAKAMVEFVGFTDDEVTSLCTEYKMDVEECRRWYNGYRQRDMDIYNPESVVQSMIDGEYDSYWSKTSSYEVISDYVGKNFDGTREDVIRMLAGESVRVKTGKFLNTLSSFRSRDDVFTYLIHVGYLAYDKKTATCRIPNKEVRQEWFYAISDLKEYKVTDAIIEASEELLASVIAKDEDAIAAALDRTHIHVTSNRSYNNEDALASAIYLAFIYALNEYDCIKEVTAGKGFADVVYIPAEKDRADRPALVIELKRNTSAESGLDQIRKKQYYNCLKHYQGNMLLVGINYDEDEKTHTCVIEKFEKED